MQQSAVAPEAAGEAFLPRGGTSTSASATDFAGLLATLMGSGSKRESAWNDDDLADDVATLSYDRALKTHSRYKTADLEDPAPAQRVDSSIGHKTMQDGYRPGAGTGAESELAKWDEEAEAISVDRSSAPVEPNKKCASITIRLSKAECAQLRRRATEAGLTVSAYLRSCTFEAEALRTQVKEALAELRSANATERPREAAAERQSPARRPWFGWLQRLLPPWHGYRQAARA